MAKMPESKNYSIELSILMKEGVDLGIWFRASGFENKYGLNPRFEGTPDSPNLRLWKRTINSENELLKEIPYNFLHNQWYRIKILIQEFHINVWIENVLVIDLIDPNPTPLLDQGKVGLQAWSGNFNEIEGRFDNIIVREIPDEVEEDYPIVLIPGHGASWNLSAILTGVPVDSWKKTPFINLYYGLKQTLTGSELGYVEGNDYFEFYYNWMKSIDNTADDFNNYIENTVLVNKPPDTKVNIISHSMGGLVTRAYAKKYGDEKINKVISVGSPHNGVLKTYYAWEGGLTDDNWSWENIALQLLLQVHRRNYQTNKDIVHQLVPSTKEMLPIFNYLKESNNTIKDFSLMTEQNDYLKNFNDNDSFKQKLVTLHGKEDNPDNDTVEYYNIVNRSFLDKLLGLWPDGYPIGKEYTLNGDLTVLTKSSSLTNVLADPEIIGDHGSIIWSELGIRTILENLNLNPLSISTNPPPERNPSLLFFLHSPAELRITTPNGKEVGYQANNPAENTLYSPEDKLIVITNAQSGNYLAQIIGTGTGYYNLEVGQLTKDKDLWQTIKGKINPLETQNLTINFQSLSLNQDILTNNSGDIFLILAKQRLEDILNYINANVSHYSSKRRITYDIQKAINYINKALNYYYQGNNLLSSRYALSALNSCYILRININNYFNINKLNLETATYSKNEFDQIGIILANGWLNLYQNSGKSINSPVAQRYKNSIESLINSLNNKLELKQDENKNLGLAFQQASQNYDQGEYYLENNDFNHAYINFLISRFYCLETNSLLRP